MAKSKFPGKPSKNLNRIRVNVMHAPNDDARTMDEDEPHAATSAAITNERIHSHAFNQSDASNIQNTGVNQRRGVFADPRRVLCRNTKVNQTNKINKNYRFFDGTKAPPRANTQMSSMLMENISLGGKFILPSRSLHSSRVIKPNKRFIYDNITPSKKPPTNITTTKDETSVARSSDKVATTTAISGKPKVQVTLAKAKLQVANTDRSSFSLYQTDEWSVFNQSLSEELRATGSILCGICGAIRLYRVIANLRVFGTYVCETCRLFIMRLIRVIRHPTFELAANKKMFSFFCLRGQGRCGIVPTSMMPWNPNNPNCLACWLQLCLNRFKLPKKLMANLTLFLPDFMQSTSIVGVNSTAYTSHMNGAFVYSSPARVFGTFDAAEQPQLARNGDCIVDVATDMPQRIDLGGPRVKHVCRSASIVFGQSPATFPSNQATSSVTFNNDTHALLPFNVAVDDVPMSMRGVRGSPITQQDGGEAENSYEGLSQNGFAVVDAIGTFDSYLCFLCGSAGNDELIFCNKCCESYHYYCAGATSLLSEWTCSRCALPCTKCKLSITNFWRCLGCRNPHHYVCLDPVSLFCETCIQCKCATSDIKCIVANQGYCEKCFNDKFKMSCSVCDERLSAYDTIIQCSFCRLWSHTRCVECSVDEYLTIRSYHLSFACSKCSKLESAKVNAKIYQNLAAGFLCVLRAIAEHHITDKATSQRFRANKDSALETNIGGDVMDGVSESSQIAGNEHSALSDCSFKNCACTETLTLLEVKRKVIAFDYHALALFYHDVHVALRASGWNEILPVLFQIIRQEFPWCTAIDPVAFDCSSNIFAKCKLFKAPPNVAIQMSCVRTNNVRSQDQRTCALCHLNGDRVVKLGGRLLFCDVGIYVHVGCALWSTSVHETLDGALLGVFNTIQRARLSVCDYCNQSGATIDCCVYLCTRTYHLRCAILKETQCEFTPKYQVYCKRHNRHKSTQTEATTNNSTCSNINYFQAMRFIYVHGALKKKSAIILRNKGYQLTVGSLTVTQFGTLLPPPTNSQANSLNRDQLNVVPCGIRMLKYFWSINEPKSVVKYTFTTYLNRECDDVENNQTSDGESISNEAIAKQVIDSIIDQLTQLPPNKNLVDGCVAEEEHPNGAADLLLPELVDVLDEELPNAFLAGISMQDILPKLMPCGESMISGDDDRKVHANAETNNNDDNHCGDQSAQNKSIDKTAALRSFRRKHEPEATKNCPDDVKRPITQLDGGIGYLAEDLQNDVNDVNGLSHGSSEVAPVHCERCRCTYRTPDSYARHLQSCEVMSLSSEDEDDSDARTNCGARDMVATAAASSYSLMINMYQNTSNEYQSQGILKQITSAAVTNTPIMTSMTMLSATPPLNLSINSNAAMNCTPPINMHSTAPMSTMHANNPMLTRVNPAINLTMTTMTTMNPIMTSKAPINQTITSMNADMTRATTNVTNMCDGGETNGAGLLKLADCLPVVSLQHLMRGNVSKHTTVTKKTRVRKIREKTTTVVTHRAIASKKINQPMQNFQRVVANSNANHMPSIGQNPLIIQDASYLAGSSKPIFLQGLSTSMQGVQTFQQDRHNVHSLQTLQNFQIMANNNDVATNVAQNVPIIVPQYPNPWSIQPMNVVDLQTNMANPLLASNPIMFNNNNVMAQPFNSITSNHINYGDQIVVIPQPQQPFGQQLGMISMPQAIQALQQQLLQQHMQQQQQQLQQQQQQLHQQQMQQHHIQQQIQRQMQQHMMQQQQITPNTNNCVDITQVIPLIQHYNLIPLPSATRLDDSSTVASPFIIGTPNAINLSGVTHNQTNFNANPNVITLGPNIANGNVGNSNAVRLFVVDSAANDVTPQMKPLKLDVHESVVPAIVNDANNSFVHVINPEVTIKQELNGDTIKVNDNGVHDTNEVMLDMSLVKQEFGGATNTSCSNVSNDVSANGTVVRDNSHPPPIFTSPSSKSMKRSLAIVSPTKQANRSPRIRSPPTSPTKLDKIEMHIKPLNRVTPIVTGQSLAVNETSAVPPSHSPKTTDDATNITNSNNNATNNIMYDEKSTLELLQCVAKLHPDPETLKMLTECLIDNRSMYKPVEAAPELLTLHAAEPQFDEQFVDAHSLGDNKRSNASHQLQYDNYMQVHEGDDGSSHTPIIMDSSTMDVSDGAQAPTSDLHEVVTTNDGDKNEHNTERQLEYVFQNVQPQLDSTEDSQTTPIESSNEVSVEISKNPTKRKKTPRKSLHPLRNPSENNRLVFKVQTGDGFSYTSYSMSDLWEVILDSVQKSRRKHNLEPLPVHQLNPYEMLGFSNEHLREILEDLSRSNGDNDHDDGSRQPNHHDDSQISSSKEKFKKLSRNDGAIMINGHDAKLVKTESIDKKTTADCVEEEFTESAEGAARCIPFHGKQSRSKHDIFSWLASTHRTLDYSQLMNSNESLASRKLSTNQAMSLRYKNMKETYKDTVGVYRSHIHGRGLFCKREIESGEIVIEYAGQMIRSSTTDVREKYYNSKGIGCYMFRIDENIVIDATMKGNHARFINHSCDPNCYSKVMEIRGHKHILIFALRKILRGEELTYDYKFPIEEDKIPCTCGARKCRKYLN